MRNFSFSCKSNSILSSSHFLICWLFWKSWSTKLIPLADKEELKIALSSISIYLLFHKHWEAIDEGKDGREEKCFSHFVKVPWRFVGNSLILLGLMLKFKWKIKFFHIFFFNQKGRYYFSGMCGGIIQSLYPGAL